MSASMCPLISTQGESGCPLLDSISQRNAGFWMMSFSVYGRLYLASTARTPALQPQYVLRYAIISGVCIRRIYHNFETCNLLSGIKNEHATQQLERFLLVAVPTSVYRLSISFRSSSLDLPSLFSSRPRSSSSFP